MKNTKKLLSITNLKKYFPVAKSSLFQKEQLYVRANEDISLDIYEGETLGIVGESGCGKSTLGRVLLQLYNQTAGTTMYYGVSLADMPPKYVADTLKNLDKYKTTLKKASEKADALNKKVEEAGGEDKADFYLLQDRNLARCDEQTALNHIVKILGGFFAVDEGNQGRDLMLQIHEENIKRAALVDKYADVRVEFEHLDDDAKNASKKSKLGEEKAKLEAEIKAIEDKTAQMSAQLDVLRDKYAKHEEFQKYEAMRDDGIDLSRLQYDEMRLLRRDLQIIFQDPYSSLNPRFTIGQIIEEGLVTHKFFKHGSEKMREHIVDTME